MSDLTVFVPTRGRPDSLVAFGSDFYATTTADTKVVFVLDEDDDQVARYISRNAGRYDYWVAHPTRRGMVGALNAAYRHFNDSGGLGFAVGFMGDDHRPRTPGWDQSYLDALRAMGSGLVYGNDLFQGPEMPTQVAFTTDIARALGYMSPPELDHLCVDLVWREWGKDLGRLCYLPDVIVEHMHYLAGKAKNDKQYRAVNSSLMGRHDAAAYKSYMEEGRFAEDIEKLRRMLSKSATE